MSARKLRRSSTNKVVSGILGGIGEYLNIDPVVVRIVFLAVTIFTGFVPGLLFYLLVHLVVPNSLPEEDKAR
ncbi:MAG: PspC domain-containing protein [Candidatus Blackburnbacteria bacterium]|nr:PspC domain-containing protein [Candidatus Blackburnbacteria bacterium]